MNTAHLTVQRTAQCKVNREQCTLHCTMYSVNCAVYSAHCTKVEIDNDTKLSEIKKISADMLLHLWMTNAENMFVRTFVRVHAFSYGANRKKRVHLASLQDKMSRLQEHLEMSKSRSN